MILSSRGRNKAGRHEDAPAAPAPENEPDVEMDSYLAALAPEADGDVESTGSGRRFGGSQVYQLRLSLMENEQLRELAVREDTSPGALARDWLRQRLEWEFRRLTSE